MDLFPMIPNNILLSSNVFNTSKTLSKISLFIAATKSIKKADVAFGSSLSILTPSMIKSIAWSMIISFAKVIPNGIVKFVLASMRRFNKFGEYKWSRTISSAIFLNSASCFFNLSSNGTFNGALKLSCSILAKRETTSDFVNFPIISSYIDWHVSFNLGNNRPLNKDNILCISSQS